MKDDIEKAYNAYMSKKKYVWSRIAELWNGLYLRVEPHLLDIFEAGYRAHASHSGWVEVSEIMKRKDRYSVRFIIGYVKQEYTTIGQMDGDSGEWFNDLYQELPPPDFFMPFPPPPQSKGGE